MILLGVIQGLTEFFPVSSSGHLVLFQQLFGLKEPQLLADVMLHVGTVLSLGVFLRDELLRLARAFCRLFFHPRTHVSDPEVKLILALVLASIPAALMGYLLSDAFERLFASSSVVGLALILTGFFLLLTRLAKPRSRNLTLHPLIIGVLQAIAIVPGLSRSGLTIGGALFLGWQREDAARFSFLLSIPAILGAAVFQVTKVASLPEAWPALLVGTGVSAASGYLALVLLFGAVSRGRFYVFSYYCFFAGLFALVTTIFL